MSCCSTYCSLSLLIFVPGSTNKLIDDAMINVGPCLNKPQFQPINVLYSLQQPVERSLISASAWTFFCQLSVSESFQQIIFNQKSIFNKRLFTFVITKPSMTSFSALHTP